MQYSNQRSIYLIPLTILVLSVLLVLQLLFAQPPAYSQTPPMPTKPGDVVTLRTAWSVDGARPGDSIILAVVADIKQGFHLNADARQVKPLADFKPFPTKVAVTEMSDDITAESPRYPKAVPFKAEYAGGNLMSFSGQTIIYLPLKLSDTIRPGPEVIKLMFEYQALELKPYHTK